ncbi:transporter [Klebsiella pneumoniae]|nr:transporter [Klebsiella pneumoniae]
MSTVTISDTPFVGNDRLLVGIVLSVLTFWLFAQSVINVVPAMKSSLDISLETLTLAVSLSALFSGCFVVASGGLADKFGRMRMTTLGLGLSIVGQRHAGGRSGTGAVPGRPGAAGAVGGVHYAGDAGAD